MDIRKITTQEQQNQYSELCKYCFNDSVGWTDHMFDPGPQTQEAWGAFEKDTLKSAVISRHINVRLFGQMHMMAGISAVASYPEARNKGYVRTLLQTILNGERKAGKTVSSLYPFSFAYYRMFGFGDLEDFRYISFSPEDILPLKNTAPLVPYDGSTAMFDDMKTVWNAYYGNFDFGSDVSSRTAEWYNQGAQDGKTRSYVAYGPTGPAGVIVYSLVPTEPFRSEMEISSLAWKDPSGLRDIMAHIASHRSQTALIKGQFHASVPLHLFMKEPRITAGVMRSWMARPLNLEDILASKLKEQTDFRPLVFSVEDPTVPDETATYEVSPAGVTKAPFSGRNPVSMPVLSSLLFGGIRPQEAYLTVCSHQWVLDAADFFMKKRACYINERF
ncbi:MAG: GNAT family N-acetyltransferase [Spirochaetales bacterium]|nr:GNAT family N-acetyltransferase [Spirochaetales bacterium]